MWPRPFNHKCVMIMVLAFILIIAADSPARTEYDSKTDECRGFFVPAVRGPTEGNPFVDVEFSGEFRHNERILAGRINNWANRNSEF